MNVGLFTAARATAPTIAGTVTVAETSGHSVLERGRAKYRVDSSVPTGTDTTSTATRDAYLNKYPLSSFKDASNRVFRLDEREVTPYMFGAVGDGAADDTDELQAFFDDAFEPARGSANIYNFHGTWGVKAEIFAAYPNDEANRRFVCGRIKVLPLAQNQAPLANVLTLIGYRNEWTGKLRIDDGNGEYYANRRFRNGIRLAGVGGSRFESILVDSARRDAVFFDPAPGQFTVRSGSPFAVTVPYSNNIGTQIAWLQSRSSGSTEFASELNGLRVAFSSNEAGNVGSGSFVAQTSGSSMSFYQASRLTISAANAAELEVGDMGKVRLEATPSNYTTIAASNSAGTLTWASGDPVAMGFQVGEKIYLHSGANNGVEFEIVGFGGTSNRTITVYPKPADMAATAVTKMVTGYSLHQIREKPSSTQILVFPWVPTRHASGTWVSMHGWAANVVGPNTANVNIGLVSTLIGGGCLRSAGLYGVHVDTVLGEYNEISVSVGYDFSSACLGTVIEHIHSEVAEVDLLQLTTSENSHTIIKGGSNLFLPRFKALGPRYLPASAMPEPRAMINVTIDKGGQPIVAGYDLAYSGNPASGLSNDPRLRKSTAMANSRTIELSFDDDLARVAGGNNWAELLWTSPTGGAPTGTLNFTLSADLTGRGWSIAGTSSVTAPAKPIRFDARFSKETKKVYITRFDAA